MWLHSVSILGNSPSSIKNSFTQKTPLICCQHNDILSLCCSIHHNTLILKFIQNQHGTFFQPIVPPFNTYFNFEIHSKTSMELSSSLLCHPSTHILIEIDLFG